MNADIRVCMQVYMYVCNVVYECRYTCMYAVWCMNTGIHVLRYVVLQSPCISRRHLPVGQAPVLAPWPLSTTAQQ